MSLFPRGVALAAALCAVALASGCAVSEVRTAATKPAATSSRSPAADPAQPEARPAAPPSADAPSSQETADPHQAAPGPAAPPGQPAWVPAMVAAREAESTAIVSCLKPQGIDASVVDNGVLAVPGYENDPELTAQISAKAQACRDRVRGGQPVRDGAFWRAQYPRLLDVAECLRAAGLEPGRAPSRDAWVAKALTDITDAWLPWRHAFERPSAASSGLDAWDAADRCGSDVLVSTWH